MRQLRARPFNTTFNRQVITSRNLYGPQLQLPKFTRSEIIEMLQPMLECYIVPQKRSVSYSKELSCKMGGLPKKTQAALSKLDAWIQAGIDMDKLLEYAEVSLRTLCDLIRYQQLKQFGIVHSVEEFTELLHPNEQED